MPLNKLVMESDKTGEATKPAAYAAFEYSKEYLILEIWCGRCWAHFKVRIFHKDHARIKCKTCGAMNILEITFEG